MGQELRAVAVHSDANRHAANLPRRRLLLHRYSAAGMAHRHFVQSRGLPYQRLSLELLRIVRRERSSQPRHDAGVLHALSGGSRLDVQDRLSVEELNRCGITQRASLANLTQEIAANMTIERIDVRFPITDSKPMMRYHCNARALAAFLTVLTAGRSIANARR
jgi:hypothetical protein